MKKLERVLWTTFYFLIFIILIKVVGNYFGFELEHRFTWFKLLFYGVPVLLLVLHSIITLGYKKAIFFMFLASSTGTFFEYIGLKYGTFFGGHYVYEPQAALFTVPISVILFWAVFIYTGYTMTNSFLNWLKIKGPQKKLNNFLLLPLLILLDGYFVVAIDLFMDPIAVASGSWKWLEGGAYFGVPWGNFLGWFVVTIISVGIFRTFEYFFPLKNEKYNKSILIIPVICYGFMALSYVFLSLNYKLTNLYWLGSLLMLPQVFLNIFMFLRYRRKS